MRTYILVAGLLVTVLVAALVNGGSGGGPDAYLGAPASSGSAPHPKTYDQ